MKITLLSVVVLLAGCDTTKSSEAASQTGETTATNSTVTTADYELVRAKDKKALLILFPGGGSTSKETKQEFNIVEAATGKNISVLLMNFNRHLWIDSAETAQLAKQVEETIDKNGLATDRIFIGGMSIGGTVALTLSNYLSRSNSSIAPKGAFIVDSPIDLYALYESSERDAARTDLSKQRLEEPNWIIGNFEDTFGSGDSLLAGLQEVSPVTLETETTENIQDLKDTKLRFYTEPDTLWWQENRSTAFENTNAFTIREVFSTLERNGWNEVELIQTKNKGYRANGERHPHSWSIVDTTDLIAWILE